MFLCHVMLSGYYRKQAAASHEPRTQMELEIEALLKGKDTVEVSAPRPVLTRAEERAQRLAHYPVMCLVRSLPGIDQCAGRFSVSLLFL